MRFKRFKIKDFVILGILVAVYTVLNMIMGILTSSLPMVFHALSPAFLALTFGGVVVLFLIHKVPKFGILTMFTLIRLIVMAILGLVYPVKLVCALIASITGDIIANTSAYQSKVKNAIAHGIMMIGTISGALISARFFLESFSKGFMGRDRSVEAVERMITFYTGYMGTIVLILNFVTGFIGIFIAYKILSKHFKKEG